MNRRAGATLVEVLVTIFVMALGLIALLTLFPIGALRMAEAIKDSRTAQAAGNADAIATARNLRNDGAVTTYFTEQQQPTPQIVLQPSKDGPSWPVYMDPIGLRSYSAQPAIGWVGGRATPGIRRTTASFIRINTAQNQIIDISTSFCLLDDITFGPDGVPIDASGTRTDRGGTAVQREGRYSWALMFKRPKSATPSVVDLTVVVYSGRPLQLLTGAGVAAGETTFEGRDGTVGTHTVAVTYSAGQERPNIKKGTWILDASTYDPRSPAAAEFILRYGPAHGFFYRVAGVVESAGRMDLQLEQPLKAPIVQGQVSGRIGRIVVMDNVAEVFEKGTGWLP